MQPVLATRSSRLSAQFIDFGVVMLAALPALFGALTEHKVIIGTTAIIFILACIALVIYQIYLLTVAGQTIGKRMMHIRIVKYTTGENGGFVTNVLLRIIVNSFIGSIIPPYGLIDVLFIFREDHRCIHDLIADTVVISTVQVYEPTL